MPTENPSSNTKVVSVPRGLIEQLEQFGEGSTPGRTVRKDALEQLYASCTEPAPQPHPDPIAWMVGTAFWWTKEEAERDAAETGLPIVGLGPMTVPAEVERLREEVEKQRRLKMLVAENLQNALANCSVYRYQLAEQSTLLQVGLTMINRGIVSFDDQIEYRQKLAALSASTEPSALVNDFSKQKHEAWRRAFYGEESAEPSAPKCGHQLKCARFENGEIVDYVCQNCRQVLPRVKTSAPTDCAICRDLGNQCMECEEGEFREWADRHFAAADYRKTDAGVFIQDWMRHSYGAWCARGAIARKQ